MVSVVTFSSLMDFFIFSHPSALYNLHYTHSLHCFFNEMTMMLAMMIMSSPLPDAFLSYKNTSPLLNLSSLQLFPRVFLTPVILLAFFIIFFHLCECSLRTHTMCRIIHSHLSPLLACFPPSPLLETLTMVLCGGCQIGRAHV